MTGPARQRTCAPSALARRRGLERGRVRSRRACALRRGWQYGRGADGSTPPVVHAPARQRIAARALAGCGSTWSTATRSTHRTPRDRKYLLASALPPMELLLMASRRLAVGLNYLLDGERTGSESKVCASGDDCPNRGADGALVRFALTARSARGARGDRPTHRGEVRARHRSLGGRPRSTQRGGELWGQRI